MKNRLLTLAAAAAFLVIATPGPQAQATAAKVPMLKAESSNIIEVRRRGYRGIKSFHHHRAGRVFHRRAHVFRHRHRPRIIYRHRGPRFGIYIGSSRCSWLRRRAIITGSDYWWRRYQRCRGWWW